MSSRSLLIAIVTSLIAFGGVQAETWMSNPADARWAGGCTGHTSAGAGGNSFGVLRANRCSAQTGGPA